MTAPARPTGVKNRKQRLADALRANLLRRKAKRAAAASQDSKKPADQSANASFSSESER
jgi:hypothetical protein